MKPRLTLFFATLLATLGLSLTACGIKSNLHLPPAAVDAAPSKPAESANKDIVPQPAAAPLTDKASYNDDDSETNGASAKPTSPTTSGETEARESPVDGSGADQAE